MSFIECCKKIVDQKLMTAFVIAIDDRTYKIVDRDKNALLVTFSLAEDIVNFYKCLDSKYKRRFERLSAYKIIQIVIDMSS
jgi:hypothetical protein